MNSLSHLVCLLIVAQAGFSTEPTKQRSILDAIVVSDSARTAIKAAERDLPSDSWETHVGRGRMNVSRSSREMDVAHNLLAGINAQLRAMSVRELFDSLKTDRFGGGGVAYYVDRDGNKKLMEELARRSKDELKALREFRDDRRFIFTGTSGRLLILGHFVRDLLHEPN